MRDVRQGISVKHDSEESRVNVSISNACMQVPETSHLTSHQVTTEDIAIYRLIERKNKRGMDCSTLEICHLENRNAECSEFAIESVYEQSRVSDAIS
jgi:hypothetical protein